MLFHREIRVPPNIRILLTETLFQTLWKISPRHDDHVVNKTRRQSNLLCTAFNCRILYGLYLPTVILTIIWYSITHSLFHSRLKTFLFCKSFPPQPSLFLLRDSLHGFPRLFTVISEHICFIHLVFLFFFTLFSCRFRAVG